MKRYLIHVGGTFAAIALLGAAAAVSGIIPIRASDGHWEITKWFLNFGKSRSVATNAMNIETPDLDEPHLIAQGAAYYEMNCQWCHGGPIGRRPRIAAGMTPTPPYLTDAVARFEPAELFYITKHGIKLTGMPAWPSQQRDDEVWAVVAFLRQLPDLDAAEYKRLARGAEQDQVVAVLTKPGPPESPPKAVTATCAMCHGSHGESRGLGAFPRLAGQRKDYLENALKAYAAGERHSGVMEPIVAEMTPQEMEEIAKFYSQQALGMAAENAAAADPPAIERGAKLAAKGAPSELVPACSGCHSGPDSETNSHYPILAGQHSNYLKQQLILFQEKRRGGSEFAHLMEMPASGLTTEQMQELANYFEAVKTIDPQNGDG